MGFYISTNECLYETSQRTNQVSSASVGANAFWEEQDSGTSDGPQLQIQYHIVILIAIYFWEKWNL